MVFGAQGGEAGGRGGREHSSRVEVMSSYLLRRCGMVWWRVHFTLSVGFPISDVILYYITLHKLRCGDFLDCIYVMYLSIQITCLCMYACTYTIRFERGDSFKLYMYQLQASKVCSKKGY